MITTNIPRITAVATAILGFILFSSADSQAFTRGPLDIINSGTMDIEPIGIEPDGRVMILVRVQGLSYTTAIGTIEEWIPFYQSTGRNSGERNSDVWFPFYAIVVDFKDKSWIVKGLGAYRGKFNLSDQVPWKIKRGQIFDEEYGKRVENEPILSYLSQRLGREVSAASRYMTYQRKVYVFEETSDSQINEKIGTHSYFGFDLGKVPQTELGSKDRAAVTGSEGLPAFSEIVENVNSIRRLLNLPPENNLLSRVEEFEKNVK